VEIWEYLCWNHCQENGTTRHFVAATNVNDTVPRFLENGVYDPKPSISNAMDVGNPVILFEFKSYIKTI
jgi:threonine synthase